jgi:curli biogenesis system outer membrane secretion channel CsgG
MKIIASFACVLFLSATAGAAAGGAQTSSDSKPRIAVIDFDYATVHTGVSAIFGTNVDVGRGIGDLLVTHLVKDGAYSVIERAALDRILAEQNFSNSDRADPSSAAKIGRLLGVDAILVGSITQFGNDTRNTGVGGVGAAAGRLGLGGVRQKQSKAIVGLNARLVNVDTGEIMAAAESLGESRRTSTSLVGGGGSWRGLGAGGVDFGSSDFQNTIIGEAVKQAVEKMTSNVVAERGRVQARQVTVQGLVAAVSGSQLVLNVGSGAGVKVGDQLTVERVTGEIKDPESGKIIRRMTSKIGLVRVVDVDEQSAVAEVVSGSDFQISDVVRSASR